MSSLVRNNRTLSSVCEPGTSLQAPPSKKPLTNQTNPPDCQLLEKTNCTKQVQVSVQFLSEGEVQGSGSHTAGGQSLVPGSQQVTEVSEVTRVAEVKVTGGGSHCESFNSEIQLQ